MRQGSSDLSLALRITLLALVFVLVQISIVSGVSVFGVSADITPLLVAFVGLACGSVPGAVTGFSVGLALDLSLVQTLGLTSLLYTLIGYWAGRVREVRDPQAAIAPLLVGIAAAAISQFGYAVMEFLLGVDAPVSFALLRQMLIAIVLDGILALPVWFVVRRVLEGALPEDPRRRRRQRAYTTGGLSPLSKP
jgi:rod shape-determining protein MreD